MAPGSCWLWGHLKPASLCYSFLPDSGYFTCLTIFLLRHKGEDSISLQNYRNTYTFYLQVHKYINMAIIEK